jgi:hemolysin D
VQRLHPLYLASLATPPAPTGRLLALCIIALITVSVVWAGLAQVDIVATTTGKTVPAGKTKPVQAPTDGVVRAVHVREGTTVRQGDVLVSLDPTMVAAQQREMESHLAQALLDQARLEAALTDAPLRAFNPPVGAQPEAVAQHRRWLDNDVRTYTATLAAADSAILAHEATLRSLRATHAQYARTLPLLREKVLAWETLMQRGYAARTDYLDLKRQLIESEGHLETLAHDMASRAADLRRLQNERAQLTTTRRRTLQAELLDLQRRLTSLREELAKHLYNRQIHDVTAPVSGTVQELQVLTNSAVVREGQQLMAIVPEQDTLEIEARILNKDVGFVAPSQAAVIKIETFRFTTYGSIQGTVLYVSRDIVQADTKDLPVNLSTDVNRRKSLADYQTALQGTHYMARIAMQHTHMTIDGKSVPLFPGMTVMVDIHTGTRRVLDFLLAPLLRYTTENLRER